MVSVEDYRLLQKLRIKCGIIAVMLGSQIHLPDISLQKKLSKKNTEYDQADKKSRELSEATRTIEEYLRQEQSRDQQKKRKRNDLE